MTQTTIRRLARHAVLASVLAPASLLSLATPADAQSTRPGVGAIPYFAPQPAGTTFRTWAPNASAVRVAGTFNNWNATSHPLVSEGNGFWSADFPYIYQGAQYKYVITGPSGTVWKTDARSADVTSSVGNSVIVNHAAYQWQVNDFQAPSWNELVIYEMHLGTFGTAGDGSLPANFDEARARLDHLEDLGINAIQLMPIAEFAGGISWGYNPSFPYAVESDYGTHTDFK